MNLELCVVLVCVDNTLSILDKHEIQKICFFLQFGFFLNDSVLKFLFFFTIHV